MSKQYTLNSKFDKASQAYTHKIAVDQAYYYAKQTTSPEVRSAALKYFFQCENTKARTLDVFDSVGPLTLQALLQDGALVVSLFVASFMWHWSPFYSEQYLESAVGMLVNKDA